MTAITSDGAVKNSGVAHGDVLLAFANAAYAAESEADPTLAVAREAVRSAVGDDGFVDACGVVGNFQRMVRIADGAGIPLDGVVSVMTQDIREELGIESYPSAENSSEASPAARATGRALRPVMMTAFRWMGRRDR